MKERDTTHIRIKKTTLSRVNKLAEEKAMTQDATIVYMLDKEDRSVPGGPSV